MDFKEIKTIRQKAEQRKAERLQELAEERQMLSNKLLALQKAKDYKAVAECKAALEINLQAIGDAYNTPITDFFEYTADEIMDCWTQRVEQYNAVFDEKYAEYKTEKAKLRDRFIELAEMQEEMQKDWAQLIEHLRPTVEEQGAMPKPHIIERPESFHYAQHYQLPVSPDALYFAFPGNFKNSKMELYSDRILRANATKWFH